MVVGIEAVITSCRLDHDNGAPMCERLHVDEGDSLEVHEKAALGVANVDLTEWHQSRSHHLALGHVQDGADVWQCPMMSASSAPDTITLTTK